VATSGQGAAGADGGGSGSGSGGGDAAGSAGQAGSGAQAGAAGSSGKNPWITFDPPTLVARSNIVLGSSNTMPTQFMPVGNGTLGAAVWAAGGLTAQLNRADTLPDRKSPGVLTIPGLARMTAAADFRGTLDLSAAPSARCEALPWWSS
jgi:hypothetical protein